jgi:creatinine amidohydrolase
LKEFGFNKVFGVNAHGDIEHQMIAVSAFKEAYEQLDLTACFPHQAFMLNHFKLDSNEPYFYTIPLQEVKVSQATVGDVHGGDMETATINSFYPHLVDTEIAKSLPDVSLGDKWETWMFGGQLKQISPHGYLGSPASYNSFDVEKNVADNAQRISDAIIERINR